MYILFGQMFGLDLTFADYVVIMVAANMIVAMPLLPSNVGPYEVAVAALLVLLGIDEGPAGAYAVSTHLLQIIWVGAMGVAAMWLMRVGLRDFFYLGRPPPGDAEQAPT